MDKRAEVSEKHFGSARVRRLSGVAGKTIKWMEWGLDENDRPHLDIQFEDGEALDLMWQTTPTIVGNWSRDLNGELKNITDKKLFE